MLAWRGNQQGLPIARVYFSEYFKKHRSLLTGSFKDAVRRMVSAGSKRTQRGRQSQ
jgi:hypothetical protein